MIELNKILRNIAYTAMLCFFLGSAMNAAAQDSDFKPSGKITGRVFVDYYYMLHADSLARGSNQYSKVKEGFNAFDFRRIYLGYTYNFSPRFTAEVLLSHEGDVLTSGNRAIYPKAANLRWKNIFKGSDLIIGQQSTPSFSTPGGVESVWAYRSIEKTLMDMRKFASSMDLGINLQGNYKDGKIGYDLMIGNNNGARIPSNSYKRVYADVYAKLLDKKLHVQLYTDYYLSKKNVISGVDSNYTRTWNINKVFAAYTGARLAAGAEFVHQTQTKATINADSVLVNAAPIGYSVFVRGSLLRDSAKMDVLSAFVRYDSWNPDTRLATELITKKTAPREAFITLGIDYQPAKNIHIMPNIWYNAYQTKTSDKVTDNSDYDLAARLTLDYRF